MENVSEDLTTLIAEALKSGTPTTIVTFSGVTALAGLLADKGLINYDEFVQAFKEKLLEEIEQN